jgi:hypothetical protein
MSQKVTWKRVMYVVSGVVTIALLSFLWFEALLGTSADTGMKLANAGTAISPIAALAAVVAIFIGLHQIKIQQDQMKDQAAEATKQQSRLQQELINAHGIRTLEARRRAYAEWLGRLNFCCTLGQRECRRSSNAADIRKELESKMHHWHDAQGAYWRIRILDDASDQLKEAERLQEEVLRALSFLPSKAEGTQTEDGAPPPTQDSVERRLSEVAGKLAKLTEDLCSRFSREVKQISGSIP